MNIIHTIFEIVGILSAILTMIGHAPMLPTLWRNRALALGANIRAFLDASGIKSPVATAMDTVKKTAESYGKFDPEETLDSAKYEDDHAKID